MPAAYSPKDDLEYSLRYWWLMVVLALAGVAAGWIFNQLKPPLYEARAEISVNINLTRTGTLTGENQDMLIDAVGNVIGSPAVMASLKGAAPALEAQTTYLERKADRFALRVVGRDPQQAQTTAEIWSELAISSLDQAAEHAVAVEILEHSIEGLSDCFRQIPSSGISAGACSQLSITDIQQTIADTGVKLQQEKAASLGLIPAIRYWLSQTAQFPDEPVRYNREHLLLAGALIGLVAGLWALHLRIPDRLKRSEQRG